MRFGTRSRLAILYGAVLLGVTLRGAVPSAQTPLAGSRDAADAAMAAIPPSWIAPHVKFLSDSTLEGRDTGSPGYQIAANYVAAQFALLGLRPAGDPGSYFQTVPVRTSAVVAGSASFTIQDGTGAHSLQYERQFFVRPGGNENGMDASGRLVFVGYGVVAPEYHYDDYAGVDVRGALVVFLVGTPVALPRDVRAVHSLMNERVRVAKAHGATGCILLLPNANAEGTREHQIRQSGATTWLDAEGRAHNLYFDDGYAIVPGEGTAAVLGTHTFEEISEHLKSGSYSFDLHASAAVHARFAHQDSKTVNVAAIVPGETGTELVAYSAHLDHDGSSTFFKGDPVLHGALDNAGGIATILAVARAFTRAPRPHRSVLFLAVTGEEKGLVGSDYFVHNPTVAGSAIVADINCDNFLWYYPLKDISGIGAEYSTLDEAFADAARRVGLQVSPRLTAVPHVFVMSDHFSFLNAGIPALSLFDGEQSGDGTRSGNQVFADYMRDVHHTPRDSYEQAIDWNAAAAEARFAFVLGQEIAGSGVGRPAFKPNAFFVGARRPLRR